MDVVLLRETFLSDGVRFSVTNYTTYRTDRPKVGSEAHSGRTGIVVKRGIPTCSVQCPALSTVEATAASIRMDGVDIVLCSLYNRPSLPIDNKNMEALQSLGPTIILADCGFYGYN